MPRLLAAIIATLTLLLSLAMARAQEANPNIRFGMPAPAEPDPESREAFLIVRQQYVLSYNAKTRTPNWVSWRLRNEDIGNAPRLPFEPDPALPPRIIAKVTSHDPRAGVATPTRIPNRLVTHSYFLATNPRKARGPDSNTIGCMSALRVTPSNQLVPMLGSEYYSMTTARPWWG
jgi:hypothetical protein